MSVSVPDNEAERLHAVRALNILHSAPDLAYDEIGELAAFPGAGAGVNRTDPNPGCWSLSAIVPAYKSSCRYTLARASTFCTAEMCHRPPRAERIPRLFSA